MKIIFFASYPTLAIGYSRIGNIISNNLAEQGHDVYYFGISNFKENSIINRYIHPNITLIDALVEEQKIGTDELYGINTLANFIETIKPDLLLLYNDMIVISRIFDNFKKINMKKTYKIFTYLDLVYPFQKINLVQHIDFYSDYIFVFEKYWKDNLIQMKVDSEKIKIFPHGFDEKVFFHVDKITARKFFDFSPEDFVILNSNRNNYRKNIDKTIDAFIIFLKIKNLDKKIKLFLNMNLDEKTVSTNYDIVNQIKISCMKNDLDPELILNNNIFINRSDCSYSDEMLNYLYNACDIGINTCIGEGFGLCNLEHGGLGKPQIISGVGALNDIFSNDYSSIIKPVEEYYIPNNLDYHGGYGKVCLTDDFVNAMIEYFDNPNLSESHGRLSREVISNKYNWDNILSDFNKNIF